MTARVLLFVALVVYAITSTSAAQAVNITVTMNGKAWTPGWNQFYDATIVLNGTKEERLPGVYDLVLNVTISIPSAGKTWRLTMNGSQMWYNVHLNAGDDVGFIPPYMVADLTDPAREVSVVERYYIHIPLHGISLTGWNINNYWTLSGVLVESNSGDVFSSWNAYFFFFRNSGSFGLPPTGTGFGDIVRKIIYYRTMILEDVWRAMESMGLYDQYWNDLGMYLNSQMAIWKAVRSQIGYYIP